MSNGVYVYDMHGKTIRRSANLRGVLAHYRAKPADIVVKVAQNGNGSYNVTFYWPDGDYALSYWNDWRVLLDWLKARRSWSISRVTFNAPLYDEHENDPRFAAFRKLGIPLTRHAYLT